MFARAQTKKTQAAGASQSKNNQTASASQSGKVQAAGASQSKNAQARAKQHSKKTKKTPLFMRAPKSIMLPRIVLISSVILLCIIGLVMVYSASSIKSYVSYDGNSFFYVKKQAIFLFIGIAIAVVAAAMPAQFWSTPIIDVLLWLLTTFLMILVMLIGINALGADRTISIAGISFQPAEFAKITLVMVLAMLIAKFRDGLMSRAKFLGFCAIVISITLVLVYKQPDLGTSLILMAAVFALAILGGFSWILIASIIAFVIAFVIVACIIQPYHLTRIISMFDPYADPDGSGFQVIRSLYAFGSGGLTGSGLGLSRQKYLYLPEAHTDFIFSIIGEEAGFIGCMVVVLLFAAFVWAGLQIARHAPDYFGCLMTGGFTVIIGFQACVNMLCVLGFAPVTGKPLPFISYGGTSLLASLIMVGLMLHVSFHSSLDAQFERRRDNLLVIKNKNVQASGTAGAAGVVGTAGAETAASKRGLTAGMRSTRQNASGMRQGATGARAGTKQGAMGAASKKQTQGVNLVSLRGGMARSNSDAYSSNSMHSKNGERSRHRDYSERTKDTGRLSKDTGRLSYHDALSRKSSKGTNGRSKTR